MSVGSSPDGYIDPGTQWNITLLQGNDESITFQFSNGAYPLDLTGYTLTMFLKANAGASDQGAFTNSPVITSPLIGEITVNFPSAQTSFSTSASSPLFYHVDGFESSSFPNSTTLVFGTVTILPI